MLERMWGKKGTFSLLMEVDINTSIMEVSLEVPQKIKNGTSYSTSQHARESHVLLEIFAHAC